MAPSRCCVGDCESTSETHRLFSMPANDNLRNLWLSFLVPTNPFLLGLTKSQLLNKRVCERHFDDAQFDEKGVRIRYSYPCLITPKEITHGVPLNTEGWNILNDHSYCQDQEESSNDSTGLSKEIMTVSGNVPLQEHLYSLPSTSQDVVSPGIQYQGLKPTSEMIIVMEAANPEQKSAGNISPVLKPEHKTDVQTKADKVEKTHAVKSIQRQIGSKTRRYIKKVTKIATDSLGEKSSQRLQDAHQLLQRTDIIEGFEKLTRKAQAFLIMQLKLARKKKMARRFSLEDKLFALALLKQSPKGYKLLESIFALPNKRTLSRMSEKIVFDTGINKNIFDHIKLCTKNWEEKKKLCTIVFDEVALTPNLIYNESKDLINGFVDIAGERKQAFSDHALVFMVRGICSSWRQTIAYYFCEGTISSPDLQRILKEIVPCVAGTGLKPLGLVCDQGSTFRSAIKSLKEITAAARLRMDEGAENNGTINIGGHDLLVFHDPPHLLKGIRNNFLDKDIVFEGKRGSWKDILYVYDLDSMSGHTRAVPNLTAELVDPKKIRKMKVSAAAKVLSARTAAMLNYTHAVHIKLKHFENDTMKTTAQVVKFFDDLFDSVNGAPGATVKGKLRCAVKKNSAHEDFWRKSIKKLKCIKFVDTNSKLAKQAGQTRHVRVPSLDGWITTLESFRKLAKLLFDKYEVQYFYPRFINQDPLENFFGRVRAMNYRNVNPDANAFIYSFKSLVMTNILTPHSKFANCEEDDGETLLDLNILFETKDDKENISLNVGPINAPLSTTSTVQPDSEKNPVLMEKIRVQTSAYTAGYMCRKLTKNINCKSCTKTYTTEEKTEIHKFIQFREFTRLKKSNLMYPNEKILRLYRECSQDIHSYLNEHCHKKNVKKYLRILIGQRDMSWLGCKKHNNLACNMFKNIVIRLQVHNWCNIINKILRGSLEEKYVMKMHNPQKLAFKKYKVHRLRSLKLNK